MYPNGDAVLHIVDIAPRFFPATFLDKRIATFGQLVEGIWLAFVTAWSLVYYGYPIRRQTDQCCVFTLNCRKQLSDLNKIQSRFTRVEACSSLVIGKRYHDPFTRNLLKKTEE